MNLLSRRAVIAAITVLAAVAPVAAVAQTSGFGDVGPSHAHLGGIAYVADAGITVGCGNGTNFCPSDPVTRGQMATFLHRASGNAPGTPPSVNAAQLNGRTAAQLTGRVTAGSRSTMSSMVGAGFAKMADLGTFTKHHANSVIEATYFSEFSGLTPSTCEFQLRIDNVNAIGQNNLDGYEVRTQSGTPTQLRLDSLFTTPISAGTHTLQLWGRGSFSTAWCDENPSPSRLRRWHVVEIPVG